MVIIATDSAADFEMEELKKMNVTYLPMSVMFGEDQYLNSSKGFRLIRISRRLPSHLSQSLRNSLKKPRKTATKLFIFLCHPDFPVII